MIYCFDLDNTLCKTKGMDYANTQPIQNRIEQVNQLYKQGHMILICTARHQVWDKFTKLQLSKWKLQYHSLQIGIKPIADFYIDDRGVSDKDFFKDGG